MFDTVFGLPTHALVVHVVVVFVPLACLGALIVAVVPRWDRTYGFLVVIASIVGAGASFVAVKSGNVLASRVGNPEQHHNIAKWLPVFASVMLVFVVALWLLDLVRGRSSTPVAAPAPALVPAGAGAPADVAPVATTPPVARYRGLRIVLAVLTTLVTLATLVWVVLTGHSGAEAVWGPIVSHTTPGSQPVP